MGTSAALKVDIKAFAVTADYKGDVTERMLLGSAAFDIGMGMLSRSPSCRNCSHAVCQCAEYQPDGGAGRRGDALHTASPTAWRFSLDI
eukprot:COSAG05_NODE_19272_length_295_cov_0.755102_1_plen_88_part_10